MRFLFVSLLLVMTLLSPSPTFANKSYGKPTLTQMPLVPNILSADGGVFVSSPWHMIFQPQSFPYDVYVQTGCWKKSFPMRIVRYWQISDICEFHPKPFQVGNSAPAVPEKQWVLTYSYNEDDLQVFGDVIAFPETSLKIVYSGNYGKNWTMMRNSVVDAVANTVSVVTDKPGGYMIMAGFAPQGAYYNYGEVKGASTSDFNMLPVLGGFAAGMLVLGLFWKKK